MSQDSKLIKKKPDDDELNDMPIDSFKHENDKPKKNISEEKKINKHETEESEKEIVYCKYAFVNNEDRLVTVRMSFLRSLYKKYRETDYFKNDDDQDRFEGSVSDTEEEEDDVDSDTDDKKKVKEKVKEKDKEKEKPKTKEFSEKSKIKEIIYKQEEEEEEKEIKKTQEIPSPKDEYIYLCVDIGSKRYEKKFSQARVQKLPVVKGKLTFLLYLLVNYAKDQKQEMKILDDKLVLTLRCSLKDSEETVVTEDIELKATHMDRNEVLEQKICEMEVAINNLNDKVKELSKVVQVKPKRSKNIKGKPVKHHRVKKIEKKEKK